MPASEPLKLVLHIGGSKCGSSAVQAFLAKNSSVLANRGIGVPSTDLDFEGEVTGEQIWAFENAVTHDLRTTALGERLTRLFQSASERGLTRLVLSAENMCNHASLASLLRDVVGEHSVKIVFYVRRQDDFLISSWQQWHLKLYDTLEAYLADRVGRIGCWLTMIEPWADAFGDDAIMVRPFVREHLLDEDVVADFCATSGISAEGLAPLTHAANPSFDEALGRLAHRVRDVFTDQHDNRFYEVMVRLLGTASLKSGSGSSLIDLETRRRIFLRYEDENAALQARFLPALDGPLFRMPSPKDVRHLSEGDKLSQDIAMLTRAVFALADRAERVERQDLFGRDKG